MCKDNDRYWYKPVNIYDQTDIRPFAPLLTEYIEHVVVGLSDDADNHTKHAITL